MAKKKKGILYFPCVGGTNTGAADYDNYNRKLRNYFHSQVLKKEKDVQKKAKKRYRSSQKDSPGYWCQQAKNRQKWFEFTIANVFSESFEFVEIFPESERYIHHTDSTTFRDSLRAAK